MRTVCYCLLLLFFPAAGLLAQATGSGAVISISGRVMDRVSGEPLEMAVVTEVRSGKQTVTGPEGNFELKGVPDGLVTLTVSYTGYKLKTLEPGKRKGIVVPLERGSLDLREVVITGNAQANTFHTLSRIDLNRAPARSAQDLLRLVPGLFIAQHQGGGKAEQIFLRGFDADHGTDVDISVDGMPVNLVSHAHGQGYADLHFLIPEIVADYDFGKGPYYTAHGDFNTAGYVAYHTIETPEKNLVKLEGGQFHTGRAVAVLNLLSGKQGDQGRSAWIAGEGLYMDGPFHLPEHFSRYNLYGRYNTPLGRNSRLSITGSTLSSGWRASGEIPPRAIAEGYIKDRFGAIDSAQGGYTSRTNANIRLVSTLSDRLTLENQAWYSHYFFNLISNFSYYYFYPDTGDEFRQRESRDIYGYRGSLTHRTMAGSGMLQSVLGWGLRYDRISPGYSAHSINGGQILQYIQYGRIKEGQANIYLDETWRRGRWLFNAGLRADFFRFHYRNMAPASDTSAAIYNGRDPDAQKAILSPKLQIQYTPNPAVQLYVKAGKGFHSNDARVVIANQGYEILPAAYAVDLGTNWKPLPRLYLNAAVWYLYLQQEFTYGADLGGMAVEPGGKTVRTGIDLSARYQFTNWLSGTVNVDLARPRALDVPKGEDYLPLAPRFTSTGALNFRFPNGLNGGISYRYMQDRPANENNSLTASGYFVTDLAVNYTRSRYELGLMVENLFDQTWYESQFAYTSQLRHETAPVDQVSFTPGVPFFARLKLAVFF